MNEYWLMGKFQWEMPFKHDIIPYSYQVVTPCLNEHSHLRRRDLVSELLQDLRWESSNRGPGPDRLAEFHWSNCREITSYHDLYMIYHDISTINIHKFLQQKTWKTDQPYWRWNQSPTDRVKAQWVNYPPRRSQSPSAPPLGARGDCTAACFHVHMYIYI